LIHAAEPGTTVADIAALMGVTLDDQRPAVEADLDLLVDEASAPPVLVPLGAEHFPGCYAKHQDEIGWVPVLAEAWVTATRCPPSRGQGTVTLLANRSPVAAPIRIALSSLDNRLTVFGCNLAHSIDRVPPNAIYQVTLAVTSPVVPITTEGKEPDLRPLWDVIEVALAKAMRAAHQTTKGPIKRGDIKEACYQVMEEAYLKASANNALPANARQIYYAARPLVQALLGPEVDLRDEYFTKTLLPAFVIENGLEERWDVVFDPRGQLREPHTDLTVPMGTLRVRDYLLPRRLRHDELISVDNALYPTLGPENRFKTLLYIEKKGFDALIRKARIQERFDCAVMSTEGTSVTAAREVVENHARQGVTILVAHDFDRSGACIAHTLGHDTWRKRFEVAPEVIDLGLRLSDAEAMGLQDEAAPDAGPNASKLREYGLPEREIEFLIRRQRRVELNAMTADQVVAWIEGKLGRHGGGKVVPAAEVLKRHARRVLARRWVTDQIALLIGKVEARAARAVLPADLATRVERELQRSPERPWEEALECILADVTPGTGT
jgi:hypothetical protein